MKAEYCSISHALMILFGFGETTFLLRQTNSFSSFLFNNYDSIMRLFCLVYFVNLSQYYFIHPSTTRFVSRQYGECS